MRAGLRIGAVVAVLLAAVTAAPAAAAEHAWPVLRVVDGDTIEVDTGAAADPVLARMSVRVAGVDTPAVGGRAACPQEAVLGAAAADYVRASLTPGRVTFEPLGWDKYGGRVDAVVRVAGVDLASLLIERRLGRPYAGGVKSDWCGAPAAAGADAHPMSPVPGEGETLRSGCCSHHGGVCGCDGGRARCCDGALSPTCGCD